MQTVSVVAELLGEQFDSHLAFELVVTGEKDFTHAAGAYCPKNLVMRYFRAFASRHFFKSAVQYKITVGGVAFDSPVNVPMRNRCPSAVKSTQKIANWPARRRSE